MAAKRPIIINNNNRASEAKHSDALIMPIAGVLVNGIIVTAIEISYLKNGISNLQEQIDLLN